MPGQFSAAELSLLQPFHPLIVLPRNLLFVNDLQMSGFQIIDLFINNFELFIQVFHGSEDAVFFIYKSGHTVL